MPFASRLTHTAEIFHVAKQPKTELGGRRLGYPETADQSGVDCQLVEGFPQAAQMEFGRDLEADGVVHFGAGVVVKPDANTSDGKPDKIILTECKPSWLGFDNLPDGWQYRIEVEIPGGAAVLEWNDADSRWINEGGDVFLFFNESFWQLQDERGQSMVAAIVPGDEGDNPAYLDWPDDWSIDHWEPPAGRETSWYALAATNNKTFNRGVKVAVKRYRG